MFIANLSENASQIIKSNIVENELAFQSVVHKVEFQDVIQCYYNIWAIQSNICHSLDLISIQEKNPEKKQDKFSKQRLYKQFLLHFF